MSLTKYVLIATTLVACARPRVQTAPTVGGGSATTAAITASDLRIRLFAFADDSMRGRAAGTPDNLRGAALIERELKRLGLQPAGENGTYFQDIPLVERRISSSSSITIGTARFTLGRDFVPRDNAPRMRPIEGAEAVFGGSWADQAKLLPADRAAGKIVVLTSPVERMNRGGMTARFPRAAAVVVATFDSLSPDQRQDFVSAVSAQLRSADGGEGPAFMYVSDALVRALFGGRASSSLAVGTTGQTMRGRIDFTASQQPARNVAAVLPGSDARLRGQYVALGAHNDHDPVRQTGLDHDSVRAFNQVARHGGAESPVVEPTVEQWARIRAIRDSLRRIRPSRVDSIYNGADDDGTGSMALLEIAEAFVNAREKPRRSILFVWHTAEELGLLGARYFTDHPTVPLDSIVAHINIDMIGRGSSTDVVRTENGRPVYGSPDYVALIGSRRLSTELGDIIDRENAKSPAPLKIDYFLDADNEPHQYYCRSDHYMYARYGIPIAFFLDGGHSDYHQVTDEPQYIEYPHYARIVQLIHDAVRAVANVDHRIVVDKPKPDPKAACVQ